MEYYSIFLLLISCVSYIQTQHFTAESPYMLIRLMDLKLLEWKPAMLDKVEKVLDAELKYTDEKKGVACKSIDFEQEAAYPKQDGRFLDLKIRGLCTDERGKVHDIDKGLMTDAIKRHISEVNAATTAVVYSVDNAQFFERNRNHLNLIIIPISLGFTIFLAVLTFFLRRYRYAQKRRHILSELEKKKAAEGKKGQTVANTDPHASEKQRLLQLDPTVVGSASGTLGSPKEFTNEKVQSPSRNKPSGSSYNREYQGASPSKDARTEFYNRDDDIPFQNQRSTISSRDRMHAPYDNEQRFAQEHQGMIPLTEQQPRVVLRTIRDDEDYPPSSSFVPIPVQVERSGPHQRYVPPPYHSDPYYRHTNT